jgi:hypothetical protein
MSIRNTSIFVLGAVAVLATTASAQDTTKTRSTRRIPITKEAGGEVALPRVDTVTVYRTDTVTVTVTNTRVDTVNTTTTVTRVDTVTVAPPARLPSGFYVGFAGGASDVGGSLYNPNAMGYTAQAQVGWQGLKNLIGARLDGSYFQPGEDSQYSGVAGDPDIWNLNMDLKLAVPFINHLFGTAPRFSLYGIGGASYIWWKNLRYRTDASYVTATGALNVSPPNTDWDSEWGWNAGGGASLLFGNMEVFAESRVIGFSPTNAPQARQIPIILGMNFSTSRLFH